MLAQRLRRWPSITSALRQCMVVCGVSGAGILKVTSIMQKSEKTVQSPNAISSVEDRGSTLKQYRLNATCLRKVYNMPGDRLVFGQRRIRLTGIEPAMSCNAGPTLNRNLVGRPSSSVSGTS